MGKRQTSTSTSVFSSVIDAVSFFLSAIASLLYQATLPITQHVFSRKPSEPTLLASDARSNKVYIKIYPRLTSIFNVETYELQYRLCTDARRGAHVAGLQEFTEYEVRAQACSGKGASGWSRPLRVLTRQRAVEGSCDCGLYRWTQTRAEPSIHVAVPESVKGKDVSVALKDRRALEIQARIGNQDVHRVEGLLQRPVKSFGNGSTWELTLEDGCKVVTVTLEKEDNGKPLWWTSALKGHPAIDLHTIPGYDPMPYDPSHLRMPM